MTQPTTDTIKAFAADYLRLQQLLNDLDGAQWQAGRSPVPREDTTERSKGLTSDPTSNTVADERRLQLRAAVIEAERALASAAERLRAAERHVHDAFKKWQG